MTGLAQLAGGVICCGFEGTALSSSVETELMQLQPAGVILFARNTENVEQTRALSDRLRSILERPIIAIDQEGGRVMRLQNGVAPIPSMRDIGATGDPGVAERLARQLGADLRRAGVNLDFAPVLDLAIYQTNAVIGDRSFGSDPHMVADFGGAFARGLRSAGVVPTFKHFPGHGSTDVDTHLDLPTVQEEETVLRGRDLVPFVRLLPKAEAVMSAHIIVRALDPVRPATLSPRILTDLLRKELGFKGVCFTDCLEMGAIARHVGTVRGAVAAIGAGADCILISHRPDLARSCSEALVRAVEDKALEAGRLHEAYERVNALRTTLC